MNFDKITKQTYALVNPVNSAAPNPQNSFSVANADLPSVIKTGIGTGQIVLEVDIQNQSPTIGGYVFALGKGSSTSTENISIYQTGESAYSLRLRTAAGTEFFGAALTQLTGASTRITYYMDLTAKIVRTYLNGIFYSSYTVANTHDLDDITQELTLFDREAPIANKQYHGFIYSTKLFYLPAALSSDDMDEAAKDLHSKGASSLLSGLKLWIEPDAIDIAANGVRNRAADTDATLAFGSGGLMVRKGAARIQEMGGVNTTAFYSRGATGGSIAHFRTASDSAFKPDNCIWESKALPIGVSGTPKTFFGDDNNALDVLTSGTDVVRFRTDIGGTPAEAVSPTIVTQETLYAAGIVGNFDGTRKLYAAANGVIGAGVATGVLDESGEFALGSQGTADANPFKGYKFGDRIIQFISDADLPTLKEVKRILAYQAINFPKLHPIVQNKIRLGTCMIVDFNGNGLIEQTPGNWVWESSSINTVVPSHDAAEKLGTSSTGILVGDMKISHVVLHVGDPSGSEGDESSLGVASNPYSVIANATADLIVEGSELNLAAYDYGSQEVTLSVSGRGNKPTTIVGAGSACKVKALNFGTESNVVVFGNGMQAIQSTLNSNAVSGTGVKQVVASVIARGATGTGDGINLTGDNCSVHNCIMTDNAGDGVTLTGVDSIATGNVSTSSTNALNGSVNTISSYNCWDGLLVSAPEGEYDLVGQTPLFVDIENQDYSLQMISNMIHGGELLTNYNTSWDIGLTPYYKKEGVDLGDGVIEIKNFGQVLVS